VASDKGVVVVPEFPLTGHAEVSKTSCTQGMVAYVYNPCIQETEARELLEPRN
jgi:hypothetical protein